MPDPYDNASDKQSVLGPTLRFKGELAADEDLVVHGQVEGTVGPAPRVTVGAQAKIKASVHAQRIVVEGSVEGDLRASSSAVIKETAVVNGNIHAPNVSIHEGAKFNGSVTMEARETTVALPSKTGTAG
jgi:cytoskeletal protein CcmA (bactofilin family)